MNKRLREEKEYNQTEWAKNRMKKNKISCDSLTEEQHDILAQLCATRHHLHMDSEERVWKGDEQTIHDTFQEINEELKNCGLNQISFKLYSECDTYETYDYFCQSEEEREEAEEEAHNAIRDIVEYNDLKIIEFLKLIDKEHDTDYAPSGMTRNKFF